jgi:hypothetical protein
MYPIKDYVDTSQYIFIGKVVEIFDTTINYTNLSGYKAEIVILRKIKSANIIEDTITISSNYSDCAMHYLKGKKYLLFCYKSGNKFFVYDCSYSGKLNKSKKYLRQILLELKKDES